MLEKSGTPVYSIYTNTFVDLVTLQPSIAGWQQPKLVVLAGTGLGATPFATFQPTPQLAGGKWMVIDPAHSPTIGEQFDALLFLGPPARITYAMPPASMCADQAYLDMRFARMTLLGFGAQVEQAKQLCRMLGGQR